MHIDLQNRLFSYGALGTIPLYYSNLLYRMTQLKNISDVNYFIYLSPFILCMIFYCLQRTTYKKSPTFLYLPISYLVLIILWLIMLKGIEYIYNDKIMLIRLLFDPQTNISIYMAILVVVLISILFVLTAKKKFIASITLCYIIYGILFLKTLNSIKEDNGIETYYFVNPYIHIMILTFLIMVGVWFFLEILKWGQPKYVFSWNKVPGEDNGILNEFLTQEFGLDWVKSAKIEKIDTGNTIRLSTEKNSLSLKLNDKNLEVIVEIDDHVTGKFIVKM